MTSKAAKRTRHKINRAAETGEGGRPPRQGVVRYSSGRINYRAEESKDKVQATVIEARIRHTGVDKNEAKMKECGYSLGRIYLAGDFGPIGKINAQGNREVGPAERLLLAGDKMAEDIQNYYRLTGIPNPSPRAMDMGKVQGRGGDPTPKAARDAADRYMGILQALGIVDTQGTPVTQLTMKVVAGDVDTQNWPPHMIAYLKRGLRSLVDFYGLGQ